VGFFYKAVQFIVLIVITLFSLLLSFHFFGFISPDTYDYFLRTLYENYLAGAIALGVFLLGVLSLLPYFLRTEPRNTVVRDGKTGAIRVSLDAVEGLIYRFVSRQEGVKEVKTVLKPVEGGLFIRLKIGVCPHQEIPDLVNDIQDSLKEYVNQVVGVKVDRIETIVHSIEDEEKNSFKRKHVEPKKEKTPKEEEKIKTNNFEQKEMEEMWPEEELVEEEIKEDTEEKKPDKDF